MEGERGEEPGEVHVQSEQRRGEGGRKDEEPQKMVPEEGVGQRMRSIGDPRLPTQAEVDNHNITHVPYRNWCPHCVRGQGRDLDHRRSVDEDRRVRESPSIIASWATKAARRSQYWLDVSVRPV